VRIKGTSSCRHGESSAFNANSARFHLHSTQTPACGRVRPSVPHTRGNRVRDQCKDCGGASICEHNRERSKCKDCGGTSICEHHRRRSICKDCGGASNCAHRRVRSSCKDCMPPPASSCDRMLGVHAHTPHDTSRKSARCSCGHHRRSPLRPRSTHTPAMPSDATGGWPCLQPPCVTSRAHHRAHCSAHGHMQRRANMSALADVYMRNVACAHSTRHTHERLCIYVCARACSFVRVYV
jgi:hypothetical protein